MNEEFENQGQTMQDGGWQSGATNSTNTTPDSGWTESGASQDIYSSQGTADSMNTYGVQNAVVQKPINIVTGIVGAFLGVLIGVVLWVLVYQMGYIAGIAGFVMMICAFKGFEILGGGINIPGSVICIVMVLVAVYFSHNISIAVSVMQEVEGYSFGAAYRYIPAFREMSKEFNSAYLHDLVLGYGLTLVAIVPSIRNVIKGGK